MDDTLLKMQPNKIRNYWDIQRQVIDAIDLDKFNIVDEDLAPIYDAIRYGIKIAHNLGYERGYENIRRKQITEAFISNIPLNIDKIISPNYLRDIVGCESINKS